MPPPFSLFSFSSLTVFPHTDIPHRFFPSVCHERSLRRRCTVLREYHNERLPGISTPCIASLARTINQSLHINDFLEVQGWSPSATFSILFSFMLGGWCLLSLLYFLYSFLFLPFAHLFWRYLHSLFFSLFFFSFAHIYIWSLFLFHPILRYTLSRFLTLLVGDIGIGVGPVNEGRWTLIPGFGRYLSLSLGWTGKGGLVCFF